MSRSLRILQIIPSLGGGGAERLVIELAQYLQDQGHEVQIIIFRNINQYDALSTGLTIKVIPSTVSYSLSGRHEIKTDELDKYIVAFSPDIIHSHLVEAELVSRHTIQPSIRYFTHWHGCHPIADPFKWTDVFSRTAWWNRLQRKRLIAQYTQSNTEFICISNFISKYLQKALPFPERRFHTIYNGGNPNKSAPHEIEPQPTTTLVSLGRLAPFKNQITLLKVARKLIDDNVSDFHLLFVGDGPSAHTLKAYTKELNLEGHVSFLGHVNEPEKVLLTADILVHSTENEAFGMAIVEAMSCGLPVVAFHSGGIPEIVEDGKNGFLVQSGNLDALTEKTALLINDKVLRKTFSESAIKRSHAFTMASFVENIEALYNQPIVV